MAASMSVANAAASGDLTLVKELLRKGCSPNERSKDGMTPLAVAAFWGYAEIVEVLLECRADINVCNNNTFWTALHCAAFQGHGKVIMKLMDYKPDLYLKDNQGRTAVDFASALDAIWPFFAAAGCKRTTKGDLIRMDIVKKVSEDPANVNPSIHSIQQSDFAHFSRPGSAYVMKAQPYRGQTSYTDSNMAMASVTGDVLAGTPELPQSNSRATIPSFSLWQH
ncbi:protein phosphatase 1 regulatory subunit 16A-like [Ylistrum balloti]|uniref:protein phosphatase 1 regulatory subunit 16A-like n=1 Tax=Ylistrum balloti TaxID=509963 RepID=UPI0029057F58|nr:protein phosphatase 1 regulatory subunit 16A-like [Ylistrum balloti]